MHTYIQTCGKEIGNRHIYHVLGDFIGIDESIRQPLCDQLP